MRILFLHTSLDIGGTEQYMLTLISRFARRGCAVDVAAVPGRYSRGFEEAGARLTPLFFEKGKGLTGIFRGYRRSVKSLSEVAGERRWDVISVQSRYVYPAGYRIARRYSIPIVFTGHNIFHERRYLPFNADAYVTVSTPVRDALARHPFVRADAIRLIRPPIDAPPPGRREQNRPSTGRGTRILFAGRFVPEKGIDTILESIPIVLAEVPDASWMFCGDGPLRPRMNAFIERRGLSGSVTVSGWIMDREKLYADADIVVLPALAREGFGLTIAEAMRRDIPVVATEVGGITDLVIDGKTGLLAPPGNARLFASQLISLLGDSAMRSLLVENARSHIGKLCDPEQRSAEVLDLLSRVRRVRGETRRE